MQKLFKYISRVGVLSASFFVGQKAEAQNRLLVGHVFAAMSNTSTIGIMVEAQKSKNTTFTDDRGYFSIYVMPHDTLFYYVEKLAKSIPYPVDSIQNWNDYAVALQTIEFDIAHAKKYGTPVGNQDPNMTLDNVTVVARNYHKDSLENRLEYDKVFNYKNPPINPLSPVQSVYDLLNVKKKKRMKRMKNDLLFEEQQGYIDSRFNRTVVMKSIGKAVDDSTLDSYMRRYRPSYEDAVNMEDIAMIMYIRKTFTLFEKSLPLQQDPALNPVINKK